MEKKLFIKVRCKAYLKKANDGVHIEVYTSEGLTIDNPPTAFDGTQKLIAVRIGENGEAIELKDLSSCEGDSVTKIYRKRVEAEFTGVVVGYTTLKCEGIIGTDWYYSPYAGEYGFCFKQTTCAPQVGVVYFKNNCKRYVLLDDMEEIDEHKK